MNLIGTGLEAVGVLVVLAQTLLYGLPGEDPPVDSPGMRLERWLQSDAGRRRLAGGLVLLGFVGTSILGLIGFASEQGLVSVRNDVAWALAGIQVTLYALVFLSAARVLRFIGEHLRAVLALSGGVFGLGVVLQFLALISW